MGLATALPETLADAVGCHLPKGEALFADDTPFKPLAPGTGKMATGRVWTDVRDEHHWKDDVPPAAMPVREVPCSTQTLRCPCHPGSAIATEALERIAAFHGVEQEARRIAARAMRRDPPGRGRTSMGWSAGCNRGCIYAHDFDSDIRRQLQTEIEKFQKLLRRLKWFGRLNRTRSGLLNALNPFNYVRMATNVCDMPSSLFARHLELFDIETATPMQTRDQGTRRIYE